MKTDLTNDGNISKNNLCCNQRLISNRQRINNSKQITMNSERAIPVLVERLRTPMTPTRLYIFFSLFLLFSFPSSLTDLFFFLLDNIHGGQQIQLQ